jgi:hypothetical protein
MTVPGDELGEHTTGRLDTESEWVEVDEEDTVGEATFTREDSTLNSGTIDNGLIWVDRLGGLFSAEEFLDELLDLGDTSRTTEEDDLRTSWRLLSGVKKGTYIAGLTPASFKTCSAGFIVFLKIHVEFLEFGAGKSLGEVISTLEGSITTG